MQCRTTDRRPALSDLKPAGLRSFLFWFSRGGAPEMCGVFVTTTTTTTTTTPLPCTSSRVCVSIQIPLHKPHSFPWLCIAKRIKVSHGYSELVETHQYSRLTKKRLWSISSQETKWDDSNSRNITKTLPWWNRSNIRIATNNYQDLTDTILYHTVLTR